MAIDQSIVRFLADHRVAILSQAAKATMDAGTRPAVAAPLAVASLAAVAWLKQWRAAIAAAAAFVVATVLSELLKGAIRRPRPPLSLALVNPGGFSMPSTNAAQTAAAAAAFALALGSVSHARRNAINLLLTIAVVWVGVCLVYLGVHWPSDVVAGWLLGAGTGWAIAIGAHWLDGRLASSTAAPAAPPR